MALEMILAMISPVPTANRLQGNGTRPSRE
jgi:hypothetical protein